MPAGASRSSTRLFSGALQYIRRSTMSAGRYGGSGRMGRMATRVGSYGGNTGYLGRLSDPMARSRYVRGRGYRRMAVGGAAMMGASSRRRRTSPYGSSGGNMMMY